MWSGLRAGAPLVAAVRRFSSVPAYWRWRAEPPKPNEYPGFVELQSASCFHADTEEFFRAVAMFFENFSDSLFQAPPNISVPARLPILDAFHDPATAVGDEVSNEEFLSKTVHPELLKELKSITVEPPLGLQVTVKSVQFVDAAFAPLVDPSEPEEMSILSMFRFLRAELPPLAYRVTLLLHCLEEEFGLVRRACCLCARPYCV